MPFLLVPPSTPAPAPARSGQRFAGNVSALPSARARKARALPSSETKRRYKLNDAIRRILPPLDAYDRREGLGERRTLEQEIVSDGGFRDPVVVWEQTNELVDGYERDDIHQKHPDLPPPKIVYKRFDSLLEAQVFRVRQHVTRRNVRPADLARHLLDDVAFVKAIKDETKKRQRRGKKATGAKGDWMQVLADMVGIGRSTIYEVYKVLTDTNTDFQRMWRTGTISPHRAFKMIQQRDRQQERNAQILASGESVPKFVEGDPLLNRVHRADVLEGLRAIPTATVHLGFTSPPYPHISEKLNYLPPAYSYDGDYPAYLAWLEEVFTEMARILVPGGRLIINTDNVNVPEPTKKQIASGRYDMDWQTVVRRNLYADLYARLTAPKVGLTHLDDIVWWKGAYVGTRPARGTFADPARPRLQRNWEDVTVYVKGGRDARLEGTRGEIEITPEEGNFWTGADFDFCRERREVAWEQDATVWRIAPNVSSRRVHPAAFPLELPWRLVLLYTRQGQTVVDPFSGIGTTAAAARALGRNYIGIEIVGGYIVEAEKRIEAAFKDRAELRHRFFPQRKAPKRPRVAC